jgi:hypothetical protein
MPIAAEVNTGQHNFLKAENMESTDFGDDFRQRAAAAWPARNGRHTEGTGVITAILHFDERSRPSCCTQPGCPAKRFQIKRLDGLPRHQFNQTVFGEVIDDPLYAGQGVNFRGGNLRVATGDSQFSVWSFTVKLPNQLAATAPCIVGHGTGVDDNLIGCENIVHNLVSLLLELPSHGVDFGLVQAAAERA